MTENEIWASWALRICGKKCKLNIKYIQKFYLKIHQENWRKIGVTLPWFHLYSMYFKLYFCEILVLFQRFFIPNRLKDFFSYFPEVNLGAYQNENKIHLERTRQQLNYSKGQLERNTFFLLEWKISNSNYNSHF